MVFPAPSPWLSGPAAKHNGLETREPATDMGDPTQETHRGKTHQKCISPTETCQKLPSRGCLVPHLTLVPSKYSHCLPCWSRVFVPGHNSASVSSPSSPVPSWRWCPAPPHPACSILGIVGTTRAIPARQTSSSLSS